MVTTKAGEELINAFADMVAQKVAARLASSRRVEKRLLTAKEAADYLGRSKGAIQHMTAAGELPVVRNGRRVHYAVEDLDKFVQENKT
jgi:excisionase family DNA binding protein